MKRIVLYGGAFSPPHLGHASVIEAILNLFPCDEIWIMPSADRLDKTVSASAEHRLKMFNIMISELFLNPTVPIIISSLEIDRKKLTTTYDTMKELEEKYPDYEFYFLLGPDIAGNISQWIDGDKLIGETKTKFITYKDQSEKLPDNLPPRLTILDIRHSSISSTMIRALIKDGHQDIPYLSKGVAEYIKKNNLYK